MVRRHETRLGLLLAAPALAVMLLVAGLPLLDAARLSLYSYRLTDPAGRAFVGLRNYRVVLSDPLWWGDVGTTLALAAFCVAVELVLGLAIALVMHRAARAGAGSGPRSSSRTPS